MAIVMFATPFTKIFVLEMCMIMTFTFVCKSRSNMLMRQSKARIWILYFMAAVMFATYFYHFQHIHCRNILDIYLEL